MANRVLDTTNASDDEAFAQIADLVENPSLTAQEIVNNYWFQSEQRALLIALPDANIDLPGSDTGRSYPLREEVVDYIIMRTVYRFLTGGGSDATGRTTTEGSGKLKSETINGQRFEYDVGSSTTASNVVDIETRRQEVLDEANRLAGILGITPAAPPSRARVNVQLTGSRL